MAFRFQSSHYESEQEQSYYGGSMGGMGACNTYQGGFGGGLGGAQMSEYSNYSNMSSGVGMGGMGMGSGMSMSSGMSMGGMGMGHNSVGGGFGSSFGVREESDYYSANVGSYGCNPCPRF